MNQEFLRRWRNLESSHVILRRTHRHLMRKRIWSVERKSFTLYSCAPRVEGSGSELNPYRSSLYCQPVKLCSTMHWNACWIRFVFVFWFQPDSSGIATFWILNSVLNEVRTLTCCTLRKVSEYRCADIEFPNLVAAYEKEKKDIGFHPEKKIVLSCFFISQKFATVNCYHI